ncbi:hypothetical protein PTKU46_93290 [Paraburkholderia terrae]
MRASWGAVAVVASEVRRLAQRRASAAREIKELIGQSVARVDTGSPGNVALRALVEK